jgi:EAL domain-containing protein (putative c-di-GMP-specific phosphodiesterase class I)/GGDEF domain-containing protein
MTNLLHVRTQRSQGIEMQPRDPDDPVRREIARIVSSGGITPHFQPIVDLATGAILGYEGLSRGPSDSFLHSPVALFDAAAVTGQLLELEHCALNAIANAFNRLRLPGQLFVNVTPTTVADSFGWGPQIERAFAVLGLSPSRVVVELTETHAVTDLERLLLAIEQLRRLGLVVALDDLGEGFASLKRWTELRPDFVKIDRHFVDGLSQDPLRQQFIRSIMDMARTAGCNVVAEGVETESDLLVLRQLGVHHAQGYIIARPVAAPRTSIKPELARLLTPSSASRSQPKMSSRGVSAGHLARRSHTVGPQVTCSEAIDMFREDAQLYALPVLDGAQRPIGLLRSLHTLSRASERYFMELFGKRSCAQLMDPKPLVFDVDSTLHSMSEAVANIDERHLIDGFLVTQEGRYWGTGRISDLLRAVSERQLFAARYANPLTQLPGNVPLDEHVDGLIAQHVPFVVVHWDIGSFKAFNDLYGYRVGDDMILFTAEVLKGIGNPECDLLGHVGGDDFVTVFTSSDWMDKVKNALAGFDRGVQRFYSAEHLEAGGYVTQNRQGSEVFHPLATLAAGVVPVACGQYESHRQVARAAAETKRIAKLADGSSFFVERRQAHPVAETPASEMAG